MAGMRARRGDSRLRGNDGRRCGNDVRSFQIPYTSNECHPYRPGCQSVLRVIPCVAFTAVWDLGDRGTFEKGGHTK